MGRGRRSRECERGVSPVAPWGDGSPDLFAATAHTVLGSDDGATFAALPGLPDLSPPLRGRPSRGPVSPTVPWSSPGPAQAGFLELEGRLARSARPARLRLDPCDGPG